MTLKPTYKLTLDSAPNMDLGETHKPADRYIIVVLTLKEAVQKAIEYRDLHDLGGGNWDQANIDRDGQPFARVSYNGRVWALDGTEIKDLNQ